MQKNREIKKEYFYFNLSGGCFDFRIFVIHDSYHYSWFFCVHDLCFIDYRNDLSNCYKCAYFDAPETGFFISDSKCSNIACHSFQIPRFIII